MAELALQIRILVRKDLLLEFRSRAMIHTALSFALNAVLMTGIGFAGFIRDAKTAAVVLWIIALFAAMTPVSHLFLREEEEHTVILLKQYFSPDAVFLSKVFCSAVFVIISLVCMAPLFMLMLNVQVADIPLLVMMLFCAGAAAACAASFAGALASRARTKGALFAVISIPALLPVLVSAVHGTGCALSGARGGWQDAAFCVAYGITLAAVSVWLFEKIWLEE